MMETSYGEKCQVETLRNLRGELSTRHELVQPRFTPVVKMNVNDAQKPKPVFNSDQPLPPPVMSEYKPILISPKSNKPSPRVKTYATLSKEHNGVIYYFLFISIVCSIQAEYRRW